MSSISDKLKRLHVTILFFLLIISGCNSTIEEHKVTASSISRSPIDLEIDTVVIAPRHTMVNVSITQSLDRKIGDGGFDTIIKAGSGSYFFPNKLSKCGLTVSEWVLNWAKLKSLKLFILKESPERTVAHVASPDNEGFFRFYYSLNVSEKTAQGTITFHDDHGGSKQLEPSDYPSLNLSELPFLLLEKMKCNS